MVICPKSLLLNWRREAEKWLIRPASFLIGNTRELNLDVFNRFQSQPVFDHKIREDGLKKSQNVNSPSKAPTILGLNGLDGSFPKRGVMPAVHAPSVLGEEHHDIGICVRESNVPGVVPADAAVSADTALPIDNTRHVPENSRVHRYAESGSPAPSRAKSVTGKTGEVVPKSCGLDAKFFCGITDGETRADLDKNGEKFFVRDTGGAGHTTVLLVNYDIVKKLISVIDKVTYDLIILDECQYIKNPKASRTQASLAIPAKRRVFLTGTPILNRPVELWPMVNAIDPEGMGKSFFGFAQRYCGAKQVRAGRKMVWDFTGASNLEELQDKMRQGFMVRRLKADVLKELPAKRRQIIPLEANGASSILKAEKKLIEQLGFEEAARALEGQSAAFTEMAKLRHDLGVAKVEKALDHIKDMLDSVEKVIVFAHHHDVIDGLRDGLSEYGLVTVTGQTPGADRQRAVDLFQTDPGCRVFLGNIKAAGVGLTLTAASTVVFVESDWTPGWMQQAEDRAHRIGQTESVLVQYLVFDGSMDAVLAQTLVSKADISDRALDREVDPKDMSAVIEHINMAGVLEKEGYGKTVPPEAPAMSEAQIDAVMLGLRILAGMCGGAREKDGVGFNGLDTGFGHRLAGLPALSQRQALVAKKMIRKYHRQLGQELINQM